MVVVEHTLNSTEDLNIIAEQLKLYMVPVFSAGNEMIQQDKARIVFKWF